MESGALQDFPILRSARDCVYLRFVEVPRRRKLHVPKTDCRWMYRRRAETRASDKEKKEEEEEEEAAALRNEEKGEGDEQAEAKPLLSARKSCSLEREFLENREKLVIKARERR